MAGVLQTPAYFQNAFRNGQASGSIVPQNVADFAQSALSSVAGISAAGTNQGTATALAAATNIVTTVSAGTGVILISGANALVKNRGANPLAVYPPSTGQIESLSTNVAYLLQAGQDAIFSFDANSINHAYVTVALNAATLPVTLPSTSGFFWNNGGVVMIS